MLNVTWWPSWIRASQEECISNSNNSLSLYEKHGTKDVTELMEQRNKGTARNITNIKSNICFCYKCIVNIYGQLQIVIDLYVIIIYVARVQQYLDWNWFGIFCCLDFMISGVSSNSPWRTIHRYEYSELGCIRDNHLNQTG